MKITATELLDFEKKFNERDGEYKHLRYGQALYYHFREKKLDDWFFDGFNMFYEEDRQLCSEFIWKMVDIEKFKTGDVKEGFYNYKLPHWKMSVPVEVYKDGVLYVRFKFTSSKLEDTTEEAVFERINA